MSGPRPDSAERPAVRALAATLAIIGSRRRHRLSPASPYRDTCATWGTPWAFFLASGRGGSAAPRVRAFPATRLTMDSAGGDSDRTGLIPVLAFCRNSPQRLGLRRRAAAGGPPWHTALNDDARGVVVGMVVMPAGLADERKLRDPLVRADAPTEDAFPQALIRVEADARLSDRDSLIGLIGMRGKPRRSGLPILRSAAVG